MTLSVLAIAGISFALLQSLVAPALPEIQQGALAPTLARAQHWEVYVASTLLGLGIGLSFATMANLIVENVRQDQTGVATGMNTVMRTLGGAFGAQVAGTLLAGQLAHGRPTAGAFTLAFAMCALALLAGIGVAALIPGRRPAPPRAPAVREPVLAGSR